MVNTGAYRPRCFSVANSLCNAHATMPGVFLLRNHAWSRELLRHWWGSDDTPHVGDTLWEQAALQAMFARARRVRHATQGTCQQELHDILEQDDGVCVCVCCVVFRWLMPLESAACRGAQGNRYVGPPVTHAHRTAGMDQPVPARAGHGHAVRCLTMHAVCQPIPLSPSNVRSLNASTPAHAVANSGSLLASLSGCAFTLGEERCAELLEETYVKTESLVWLGTDDDMLDEQLGL